MGVPGASRLFVVIVTTGRSWQEPLDPNDRDLGYMSAMELEPPTKTHQSPLETPESQSKSRRNPNGQGTSAESFPPVSGRGAADGESSERHDAV